MNEIRQTLKNIAFSDFEQNGFSVDYDIIDKSTGEIIDSSIIDEKLCFDLNVIYDDNYLSIWSDFLTDVGISCYSIENQCIDFSKLNVIFDKIDNELNYSENPDEFKSKLKYCLNKYLIDEYEFSNLIIYEYN